MIPDDKTLFNQLTELEAKRDAIAKQTGKIQAAREKIWDQMEPLKEKHAALGVAVRQLLTGTARQEQVVVEAAAKKNVRRLAKGFARIADVRIAGTSFARSRTMSVGSVELDLEPLDEEDLVMHFIVEEGKNA